MARTDHVASFTDAWIETLLPYLTEHFAMSHLLQMRGLKLLPPENKDRTVGRIFYRCVD